MEAQRNVAKRLGLRRQVARDAALLPDADAALSVSRDPKAPSPLRSAGAVQNLADARGIWSPHTNRICTGAKKANEDASELRFLSYLL